MMWNFWFMAKPKSCNCRQRNSFDLPDFISAVKCMAAKFQSYEYTLSEIFMTCGTQLNT